MFLSVFKYYRDAALVKKYTGATLTRDQFRQYEGELTLRKVIGSDRAIWRKYYGFGTPMEQSRIDVMCDILNELSRRGVVFNIEEGGNNEELFSRLAGGAAACLRRGCRPRIPISYRASPRLSRFVDGSKRPLGLKTLENVT